MTDQRDSTRPTSTIDGDTWRRKEGPNVRSRGLNAPEMTRGSLEPGAIAARDMAERYADGGHLRITGEDRHGRGLGVLTDSDGRNFDYEAAYQRVGSPAFDDPTAQAGRINRMMDEVDQGHLWNTGYKTQDDVDGERARMERVHNLNRFVQGEFQDRVRGQHLANLAPEDSVTSRAWQRGLAQGQNAVYGTTNAIGNAIGSEFLQDWGAEGLHNAFQRTFENPPEIGSLDDVDGLAEFFLWSYEKIIEESPMLAVDLASYAAGAATGGGSVALARMGKGMLRATHGANGVTRANDMARAIRRGASVGGDVAAGVSMTSQAAGNTQQDMFNHGVTDNGWQTLAAGGASGLVNLASFKLITGSVVDSVKRGMDVNEAAALFSDRLRNLGREVGSTTAVGALAEGVAGTGDGIIAELNRVASVDGYEFNPNNLIESAVTGAVVGGSFAGGASTVGGVPAMIQGIDRGATPEDESGTKPEPPSQLKAMYRDHGDKGVFVSRTNVNDGVTLDDISRDFPDVETYELAGGDVIIADNVEAFEGLNPDMTQEEIRQFLGYRMNKEQVAAAVTEDNPLVTFQELDEDGVVQKEQSTVASEVESLSQEAIRNGRTPRVVGTQQGLQERENQYTQEVTEIAERQQREAAAAQQQGQQTQDNSAEQISQEQAALDAAANTEPGRNRRVSPMERTAAFEDSRTAAESQLNTARETFNRELRDDYTNGAPLDERLSRDPNDDRTARLSALTQELTELGGDPNSFVMDAEATDRDALLAILQRERNEEGAARNRNTVDGYEGFTLNDLLGDRQLTDMDTRELEALAKKLRVSDLPKKVGSLSANNRNKARERILAKLISLRTGTIPNDLSGWAGLFPVLDGVKRDKGSKQNDDFALGVRAMLPNQAQAAARIKELSDGELMTALYQTGASVSGLRSSELTPNSNERSQGRVSDNQFATERRLDVQGIEAEINRLRGTRSENRAQKDPANQRGVDQAMVSDDVIAGAIDRHAEKLMQRDESERKALRDIIADNVKKLRGTKEGSKERKALNKKINNLARQEMSKKALTKEEAHAQATAAYERGELDADIKEQAENKRVQPNDSPIEKAVLDDLKLSEEQADDLLNAGVTTAIIHGLTQDRELANTLGESLITDVENVGKVARASSIYAQSSERIGDPSAQAGSPLLRALFTRTVMNSDRVDQQVRDIETMLQDNPEQAASQIHELVKKLPSDRRGNYATLQATSDNNRNNPADYLRGQTGEQTPQRTVGATNDAGQQAGSREPGGVGGSAVTSETSAVIGGDTTSPAEQSDRNFFGATLMAAVFHLDGNGAMIPFTGRDILGMVQSDPNSRLNSATQDRRADTIEAIHSPNVQRRIASTQRTEALRQNGVSPNIAAIDMVTRDGVTQSYYFDMVEVVGYGERGEAAPTKPADYYRAYLRNISRLNYGLAGSHYAANTPYFQRAVINNFNMHSGLVIAGDTPQTAITLGEARDAYRKELEDTNLAADLATENDAINIERETLVPILEHYLEVVESRQYAEEQAIAEKRGDEAVRQGYIRLRLDLEEKLGFAHRDEDVAATGAEQGSGDAGGITGTSDTALFRQRRVAKLEGEYAQSVETYGADSEQAEAAYRRLTVAEGIMADDPAAIQAVLDNARSSKESAQRGLEVLQDRLAKQQAHKPEENSSILDAEIKAELALEDLVVALGDTTDKTPAQIHAVLTDLAIETARLQSRTDDDTPLFTDTLTNTRVGMLFNRAVASLLRGDNVLMTKAAGAKFQEALDAYTTVNGPVKDARLGHIHNVWASQEAIAQVEGRIANLDRSIAEYTRRLELANAPFEAGTETQAAPQAPKVEPKRPNLSLIRPARNVKGEVIAPKNTAAPAHTYRRLDGTVVESSGTVNFGEFDTLEKALHAVERVNRKGRELRKRLEDFYTTPDDTEKAMDAFADVYVEQGYSRRDARVKAAQDIGRTDRFMGGVEGSFEEASAFGDNAYRELSPDDINRYEVRGDATGENGSQIQADNSGAISPADIEFENRYGEGANANPNSSDNVVDYNENDPVAELQKLSEVRERAKTNSAAIEAHTEQYKKDNPEAFEAFLENQKQVWVERNPLLKAKMQEEANRTVEEQMQQGVELSDEEIAGIYADVVDRTYQESPDVYAHDLQHFYELVDSGKLDTLRGVSPQFYVKLAGLSANPAQAAGGLGNVLTPLDRFFGKRDRYSQRANNGVRFEGISGDASEVTGFVQGLLKQFKATDRPTLVTVGRTTEQTLAQIEQANLLTDDQMAKLRSKLDGTELRDEPVYISVGEFSVVTMPERPKSTGQRATDELAAFRWFHQLGHELGHLVFDEYKGSIMANRAEANMLIHSFESYIGRPMDTRWDMGAFDEWFADKAANEAIARHVGESQQQADFELRTRSVFGRLIDKMEGFYKSMIESLPKSVSESLRRFVRTSKDRDMFLEMADNIQRGVYATRTARPPQDTRYSTDDIYTRKYTGGDTVAENRARMGANVIGANVKKAGAMTGKGAMGIARSLFADTVYRIGRYSKDLEHAIHQRTGGARNNNGVQAFAQLEASLAHSFRGALNTLNTEIGKGLKGKVRDTTIRKAIQDYERTGTGPVAEFISTVEQSARRAGFKSIPTRLNLPAALNHEGVMKDESAFRAVLQEAFPNETSAQLDKRMEALQTTHGMTDFSVAPGLPVGTHDTTRVLLEKIGHARLREAGFLHDKSEATLLHFIDGLARRTAWEANFGDYTENSRVNYDRFVVGGDRQQVEQLQAAGLLKMDGDKPLLFDPSAKYRAHLDDIQARHGIEARHEVEGMMDAAMGGTSARMNKKVRATNDWVTSLVSKTILAFAGIMSIPEMSMPAVRSHGRVGAFDGISGLGQGRKMAVELGIIVSDAIESVTWHSQGDNYESSTLRKIDQVYFKANGMKLVMDTTRALGVSFGTRYFTNSANMNDTATLSKFGLTPGDVHAWNKAGQPTSLNSGDPTLDAISERVHHAISQFVAESSATANRFQAPGWFNNPYLKVFWMIKRYMYAYADNLIGGILRNTKSQWDRGNGYADKAILATLPMAMFGLVMMPMAMAADELRERMRPYITGRSGKTMDQYDSLGQYATHVFDRTGGFGPVGLALQMRQQSEWGMSPIEASSPVFAKASLLYDWGEEGYSNEKALGRVRHFVPFFSQAPAAWNKIFD